MCNILFINPSKAITVIPTTRTPPSSASRKKGSQSLNTDQGSSDGANKIKSDAGITLAVSIPQYRSGQFRPYSFQGLEVKGVRWPVFPTSLRELFFEGRVRELGRLPSLEISGDRPLSPDFQPMC